MSDVIRVDSAGVGEVVSGAVGTARPLPGPRVGVRIRPGVEADFAFIDDLQKRHSKAVGFMFAGAIKGHIEKGHVLIAEAIKGVGDSGLGVGEESDGLAPNPNPELPNPVGYLIGVDRYLKRDELGIIYQMNIEPAYQRSLVAANLLKAQFDRSAYGCRLYCCWCAQDLAANKFWEAMGFVPLAFRTGGGRPRNSNSKKQPRMHIFWQKRIRPRKQDPATGDWVEDDTPYWFPSQTGAGAIGEDRLVLPIPPGTHWSDAKPVVLPEGPTPGSGGVGDEVKLLEARVSELEKAKKAAKKGLRGEARGLEGKAKAKGKQVKTAAAGGLHFGPIPGAPEVSAAAAQAKAAADESKAKQDEAARIEAELKQAKKDARRAKKKFDPAQEAFARELKDRWLEQVADRPGLLAAAPGTARYDVARAPGIAPLRQGGGVMELEEPERLPEAA